MIRFTVVIAAVLLWALGGCHSHSAHEQPDHGSHAAEDHSHDRGHGASDEYIAHLENPERARWQRPDEVVAALSLRGDETVVDIGAGSGYFTLRLAAAVPEGTVYGTDIEQYMIDHLAKRVEASGAANVVPVLTRTDDPGVPEGTDLVFICNVLHHVDGQEEWLARIRDRLASDGRIALIEFVEGELSIGPPPEMKIPRAEWIDIFKAAGFALAEDHSELLPYQHFFVFRAD